MKSLNGLRIFIPSDKGPAEDNVYYSQRGHGPIYRWYYEKHHTHWHVTRVDVSLRGSHQLCITSWQSVPQDLKAKLSEHYID